MEQSDSRKTYQIGCMVGIAPLRYMGYHWGMANGKYSTTGHPLQHVECLLHMKISFDQSGCMTSRERYCQLFSTEESEGGERKFQPQIEKVEIVLEVLNE